MQKRKIIIYNELFNKTCSKDELAKKCGNVSVKTIENTIKECEDIVYSKKLGAYHFKNLLPSQISYQNYFDLFKDNLSNPILKKDMIKSVTEFGGDLDNIMFDTTHLSELSKKIIKLNTAINHNCIVKLFYKRDDSLIGNRYIRPKQIITFDSIYYLYFEYDKKNKERGLQTRPFAFNGIENIEEVEYLKESKDFRTYKIGNSFGTVDEAKKSKKSVTLKLHSYSAYFFTREGLFESPYYNFIRSNSQGNEVEMEMIYNDNIEVIKLVQQWLPYIYVVNDSKNSQSIIDGIKKNYNKFLEGCE